MEKKKGFIQEFKEFISRGNVLDLAVGVIIGGAFTAIVKSLVDDVFMPIAGIIIGGLNFSELKFVIKKATETQEELAISYGNFIQALINFLIMALIVFVAMKLINGINKKKVEEEAVAEPAPEPDDVVLLREIRDLLKKN